MIVAFFFIMDCVRNRCVFKDIDQILPVASSALMFGSAVFYPLEVLPINIRGIFELISLPLLSKKPEGCSHGPTSRLYEAITRNYFNRVFSELVLKSFNRVKENLPMFLKNTPLNSLVFIKFLKYTTIKSCMERVYSI